MHHIAYIINQAVICYSSAISQTEILRIDQLLIHAIGCLIIRQLTAQCSNLANLSSWLTAGGSASDTAEI